MIPQILIDAPLLFLGITFTLLLPGFLVIESFFEKMSSLMKIPLYVLLSTLISAFSTYLLSLVLEYSRLTVFLSALPFLVWFCFELARNKKYSLPKFSQFPAYFIGGLTVFLIFFVTLYSSYFYDNGQYIVMGGDSWQDGPLHLSIIQSISQGNFPPQMPYFSGRPLNYYYFINFHTSITEVLYGHFLPRLVVFVNSVFAAVLFLTVNGLTYLVFRSKLSAFFGGIMAVFGGNLIIIKFVRDLADSEIEGSLGTKIVTLLSQASYSTEYPKIFQVLPTSNYLIQNRPMMIGLSILAALIYLFLKILNKPSFRMSILTGIVSALLLKFQAVTLVAIVLFLPIFYTVFLVKHGFKKGVKYISSFILTFTTCLFAQKFLFPADHNFFINMASNSFRWGSWIDLGGVIKNLEFILLNFHLFFFLPLILFSKLFKSAKILTIYLFLTVLFLIPYIFSFTINEMDMLRFFSFYLVISAMFVGYGLSLIYSKGYLKILVLITVLIACSNSLLDLGNNLTNKNQGYSFSDLEVGRWIQEKTPQKSIFVTTDSVHSPVSDIGGRLRVLSYTGWAYTHGYNTGNDNVFSRWTDMDLIYKNLDNNEILVPLVNKYGVDYVYYGLDEQGKYPDAKSKFEDSYYLTKVFENDETSIYKFTRN